MDRVAVSLDKYLVMYGCWWIVLEITTEESDGGEFQWERVRCKWSYLGPMPLWHKEERFFLVNRRRVRWWVGRRSKKIRNETGVSA